MEENGYDFIDSKLEREFEDILESSDIEYIYQKHENVPGSLTGAFYDFYLLKTDTYIEVHGDFWHCNEDAGYEVAEYEAQKRNLKRDKEKRAWCEENDKDLLVFWERDIQNNRQSVVKRLLEYT